MSVIGPGLGKYMLLISLFCYVIFVGAQIQSYAGFDNVASPTTTILQYAPAGISIYGNINSLYCGAGANAACAALLYYLPIGGTDPSWSSFQTGTFSSNDAQVLCMTAGFLLIGTNGAINLSPNCLLQPFLPTTAGFLKHQSYFTATSSIGWTDTISNATALTVDLVKISSVAVATPAVVGSMPISSVLGFSTVVTVDGSLTPIAVFTNSSNGFGPLLTLPHVGDNNISNWLTQDKFNNTIPLTLVNMNCVFAQQKVNPNLPLSNRNQIIQSENCWSKIIAPTYGGSEYYVVNGVQVTSPSLFTGFMVEIDYDAAQICNNIYFTVAICNDVLDNLGGCSNSVVLTYDYYAATVSFVESYEFDSTLFNNDIVHRLSLVLTVTRTNFTNCAYQSEIGVFSVNVASIPNRQFLMNLPTNDTVYQPDLSSFLQIGPVAGAILGAVTVAASSTVQDAISGNVGPLPVNILGTQLVLNVSSNTTLPVKITNGFYYKPSPEGKPSLFMYPWDMDPLSILTGFFNKFKYWFYDRDAKLIADKTFN